MPSNSFTPLPALYTERLLLRQLVPEDAPQIFALRTDDAVNKYLNRPKPQSMEDALEFIKKINFGIAAGDWVYYWAICLKEEVRPAGTICLWNFSEEKNKSEIGYELLPSFQGRGIMQEALLKVVEFGFDILQLSSIEAWTDAQNLASTNLLEKNFFKRDLYLESKMDRNVEGPDMVIYSCQKIIG